MVFGSGSNLIIRIISEHCITLSWQWFIVSLQTSETYTMIPTPMDPEK